MVMTGLVFAGAQVLHLFLAPYLFEQFQFTKTIYYFSHIKTCPGVSPYVVSVGGVPFCPDRDSTSLREYCTEIYMYKRGLSVCLVCLFVCSDFKPKLLDGSKTKFGKGLPLDHVGNLKMLFWVDPPRGGIILEKLKKSKLFPYGPGRRVEGILLRHLLRK